MSWRASPVHQDHEQSLGNMANRWMSKVDQPTVTDYYITVEVPTPFYVND